MAPGAFEPGAPWPSKWIEKTSNKAMPVIGTMKRFLTFRVLSLEGRARQGFYLPIGKYDLEEKSARRPGLRRPDRDCYLVARFQAISRPATLGKVSRVGGLGSPIDRVAFIIFNIKINLAVGIRPHKFCDCSLQHNGFLRVVGYVRPVMGKNRRNGQKNQKDSTNRSLNFHRAFLELVRGGTSKGNILSARYIGKIRGPIAAPLMMGQRSVAVS